MVGRITCLVLAFFALLFGLSGPAAAWQSCVDSSEANPSFGRSVQQLVDAAEYIGLYTVIGAMPIVENDDIEIVDFVRYRLEIVSNVMGNSPRFIEIIGLRPFDRVPQVYFAVSDLHAGLDVGNPEVFGLATPVIHPITGKCEFVPQFLIGYSYLILGKVDSQINFEMIPSRGTDRWYRVVLDAVSSRKSTDVSPQEE